MYHPLLPYGILLAFGNIAIYPLTKALVVTVWSLNADVKVIPVLICLTSVFPSIFLLPPTSEYGFFVALGFHITVWIAFLFTVLIHGDFDRFGDNAYYG